MRTLRLPIGVGMFGKAVADRRVVVTGDYAADTRFVHAEATDRFVDEIEIRSMVVPYNKKVSYLLIQPPPAAILNVRKKRKRRKRTGSETSRAPHGYIMVYTGYLNPARRIEEKYWDHAFASWHSSFEVGLTSPFGVSLALESSLPSPCAVSIGKTTNTSSAV
jgi:hypothetical protein